MTRTTKRTIVFQHTCEQRELESKGKV